MIITVQDRATPAHVFRDVDQRVRLADYERITSEARRLGLMTEQRSWKNTLKVRWQPSESRAATGNHRAAVLTALKAKDVPALTTAIVAAYTVGYGDGGDDSTRLASLTDEAPTWAKNLVGYLTQPGAPDELDVADQTATTCESAGATAATRDGIEADGGTQERQVPDAGACQACQDAGGLYPLDGAPGEVHPRCGCEVTAP